MARLLRPKPRFSGIRNVDVAEHTEDARWSYQNEDEFLFWPRVQWIDPGGVSGVSVIWFDPKAVAERQPLRRCILGWHERFLHGPEIGKTGQIAEFLRLQRSLSAEPGLVVGVESFVPMQINYDADFLAPVRIGDTIRWYNSLKDITTHKQSPSDAKKVFDDGRLKEMGMYTPGPDHVRDSTRHCLLWIRKLSGKTPQQIAEFHGYEKDWYNHA